MTNLLFAIAGAVFVFLAWRVWFDLILPQRPKHIPRFYAPPIRYAVGEEVTFIRDSVGVVMPNGTLYATGEDGVIVSASHPAYSVELKDGRVVLAPSFHMKPKMPDIVRLTDKLDGRRWIN
jgi:hypothetical protein